MVGEVWYDVRALPALSENILVSVDYCHGNPTLIFHSKSKSPKGEVWYSVGALTSDHLEQKHFAQYFIQRVQKKKSDMSTTCPDQKDNFLKDKSARRQPVHESQAKM